MRLAFNLDQKRHKHGIDDSETKLFSELHCNVYPVFCVFSNADGFSASNNNIKECPLNYFYGLGWLDHTFEHTMGILYDLDLLAETMLLEIGLELFENVYYLDLVALKGLLLV